MSPSWSVSSDIPESEKHFNINEVNLRRMKK